MRHSRMGLEERILRIYRGVALAAAAVAAFQPFLEFPRISPWTPAVASVSFALFAVAFWAGTRHIEARLSSFSVAAILAGQLQACLGVPELLFVSALGAPMIVSGRRLAAWASCLAVATTAILWARAPAIFLDAPEYAHLSAPAAVTLHCLHYLAWQAIVLTAAALGAGALRSRRSLARLNAELAATRELLSDGARSAERVRLSHEIDDAMGHQLTELILQLELAAQKARPPADAPLRSAQALSRRLLEDVRDLVGTPGPTATGVHVDLGAALRTLTAGLLGPRVHLSLPGRLDTGPLAAHVAFRCVQEALTNSLHHSGARNVWIEARPTTAGLVVEIRDDGRGAAALREGNGLAGMRDRVEELGGELWIATSPRRGFRVCAFLPGEGDPDSHTTRRAAAGGEVIQP